MNAIRFEIVPRKGGYRALCRSAGPSRELIWWTEVYSDKRGARHAIRLLKEHAASAKVYDKTG